MKKFLAVAFLLPLLAGCGLSSPSAPDSAPLRSEIRQDALQVGHPNQLRSLLEAVWIRDAHIEVHSLSDSPQLVVVSWFVDGYKYYAQTYELQPGQHLTAYPDCVYPGEYRVVVGNRLDSIQLYGSYAGVPYCYGG